MLLLFVNLPLTSLPVHQRPTIRDKLYLETTPSSMLTCSCSAINVIRCFVFNGSKALNRNLAHLEANGSIILNQLMFRDGETS